MRMEHAHTQYDLIRAQRMHDRRERSNVIRDKLRRHAVRIVRVHQARLLGVETALLPQCVEGRLELREIGRVVRVPNVALNGERVEHALFGGGDAVGGGADNRGNSRGGR